MSIVKDLLLIGLFLYLFIKNIQLYQTLQNQRKYFINTLSHDLRVSTIAQIRGLELLTRYSASNNLDLIQDINKSCRFSLDMINMLLNTFKFEEGEKVLNKEEFSLCEIIRTLYEDVKEEIREKNIEIIHDMDKECRLIADKTLLYKAFLNLLMTAILNAKRNTKIKIFIKTKNNGYKIRICYEGLCLTDEEIRKMYSYNSSYSTVGHGIRMHLVKKIIELHQGIISIEKNNERYNSFTFTIPSCKEKTLSKTPFMPVFQAIER